MTTASGTHVEKFHALPAAVPCALLGAAGKEGTCTVHVAHVQAYITVPPPGTTTVTGSMMRSLVRQFHTKNCHMAHGTWHTTHSHGTRHTHMAHDTLSH